MVVVARGTESDARSWLDAYKSPYQLLLDLPLRLYRELGLRRSVKAVWRIVGMMGYAEDSVAGVPGYPSYPGDDIHLMGGDFITNSTGTLVFTHASTTPSDRPSLQQILSALDAA